METKRKRAGEHSGASMVLAAMFLEPSLFLFRREKEGYREMGVGGDEVACKRNEVGGEIMT